MVVSEPTEEPAASGLGGEGGLPYSETSADPLEVLFPPLFMVGFCIVGFFILSCLTQKLWWKLHCKRQKRHELMRHFTDCGLRTNLFLTSKEEDVLLNLEMFQNRPFILLQMASPALLSMVFCPLSLYMYLPMVKYFWPPSEFSVIPNANDCIQAFLTPAGLVYAIAFGFAFQEATSVQSLVSQRIADMVNTCFNIAQGCMSLDHIFTQEDRTQIIFILKEECIIWIRQLLSYSHKVVNHSSRLKEILSIISKRQHEMSKPLDEAFVKKLMEHVYRLEELTIQSLGKMCGSMNFLQWSFLEALAYLAFFGVLMLNGQSYRFQVCICIITVFSISMFCYILADLDNPYHGFFRVDLSILPALIQGLSNVAAKNSSVDMKCSNLNLKCRDNVRLSLDDIVLEKFSAPKNTSKA